MEPKGWYSLNYYCYTPEEIKQQERVERRRLEREANTPPPPVRATGSMGKTRYLPGTAKKPAAKPVPTPNRYGLLAELETDYRKLPWFQPQSIPKESKKPKVNPKDYISFDEYAKRRSKVQGFHGSVGTSSWIYSSISLYTSSKRQLMYMQYIWGKVLLWRSCISDYCRVH